jgi:DNA polymerase-3 subunit delta'
MNKNIESWQVPNWNYLTQLSTKKKLPHSLLLQGAKGLGLYSFAETFATWLLCDKASNENTYPCGQCTSCQWIAAGTHPDHLIITPETNHIKVDAIREIRSFSENKSLGGRYRIIIIAPAEAMNVSAANALLKILEEPFENTIFLLISHHMARVLPTILSRCQKIHFSSLNKNDFTEALAQRSIEPHMINQLYELSHGEPLAFSTLQEQEIAVRTHQKLVTLMEKCFAHTLSPIEAAEQIKLIEKESKMSFENLIDMILNWLYNQIKKQNNPAFYAFYDKLMVIKKHTTTGAPINQVLWLEDLFYAC